MSGIVDKRVRVIKSTPKEQRSPIQSTRAEDYRRIIENLDALEDGEEYQYHELESFFEVKMNDYGKTLLRKALTERHREWDILSGPQRGTGIRILDHTQVTGKVLARTDKGIRAMDRAKTWAGWQLEKYSGRLSGEDSHRLGLIISLNNMIINRDMFKPLPKKAVKTIDTSGVDATIPGI